MTTSDKIDRIVTNRILGIPIFIAVMFVVYYISVTTIGTIVTDWTNDTFVVAIQDIASKGLEAAGVSSVIEGLVVDGIIGGIGAVLGFVPQMAILFLFLSILERLRIYGTYRNSLWTVYSDTSDCLVKVSFHF